MSQTIPMAAAILMLSACTREPRFRHEVTTHAESGLPAASRAMDGGASGTARAQAELQSVQFDGRTLSGRLLVTAVEGSILLDTRLIESIVLTTESIAECDTGRKLSFLEMDVLSRLPRDENLWVLKPGYWFGKDVRIPLFTEGLNGPDVACIEADFTFHPREGGAARLRVRAMRSAPDDAGAVPLPSMSDAGAGMTGP
jgi:hypothetical protein